MAWNRPTLEQIIDRIEKDMESRLTGNVSLLKIAVLRVLARVFAGAVHIAYGYLEEMGKQLMIDTADSDFLGRHAFIWGISRKAASFATGKVVFTGADGTTIPATTELQTSLGVEYTTTADGVITNGFAEVDIQAKDAGAAGNLLTATELEMVSPVTGIDETVYSGIYELAYTNVVGGAFVEGNTIVNNSRSGTGLVVGLSAPPGVLSIIIIDGTFEAGDNFDNGAGVSADVDGVLVNVNQISGGEDEENDEDLRARIMQRIQEQPAGGAAHDYVRWSREVLGVENAWVKAATPSPGWVTVIVKASGANPVPSTTLCQEVSAYLDQKKPVTADTNIVPITRTDIDFMINISPNTAEYQTLITENLRQLFNEVGAPGEKMLISRIYNAISTTGVSDYEVAAIDKDGMPIPVADIELTGYEYAVVNLVAYGSL